MTYFLNFALDLKLDQDESRIVYNPEQFTGSAVSVSVPEIVKLVKNFLENFQEKPIVNESPKAHLATVEDKAYILSVKHLDKQVLTQIKKDIIK
ncbi:MAG: hypothetical protein SAJ12_11715, partial [Jaaginema sp. PMC 1079.18]|nr:hypothetical protein [Jaaginema sp. PMC 1079.18]